jgi:hypothetical protein
VGNLNCVWVFKIKFSEKGLLEGIKISQRFPDLALFPTILLFTQKEGSNRSHLSPSPSPVHEPNQSVPRAAILWSSDI